MAKNVICIEYCLWQVSETFPKFVVMFEWNLFSQSLKQGGKGLLFHIYYTVANISMHEYYNFSPGKKKKKDFYYILAVGIRKF